MSAPKKLWDCPDPPVIWSAMDELAEAIERDPRPELIQRFQWFCANHRIETYMRPRDGRGAVPAQLSLWDAFFQHEHRIYAACGSNQAGKTIGVGVCACKWIRDYAKDGDVYWVMAQSYKTLKDIPLKTLYDMLPASMFPRNRSTYDPMIHEIGTLRLELPGRSGSVELWFFSEDQGLIKIESSRVNGVWWTECASQAHFDALLPRLVTRGGWMLLDYVPFEGWHRTVIREKANRPDSPIFFKKFVIADNVNLSEKNIRDMKQSMSKKQWEVRGLGMEAAAQGAVYQNFDPDVHCIKPFKVPDHWPLYMAGDWGFNAPHAFGLLTVSPNETLYLVAEEYREQMGVMETTMAIWEMVNSVRPLKLYQGCDDSGRMFERMRQIDFQKRRWEQREFMLEKVDLDGNVVREHVNNEFNRVLASPCAVDNQVYQDHGGIKTLAAEFIAAGMPIRPAVKRSIDATVEIVRRLFDAKRLFFFDTCYHVREDHVAWKYKEGRDRTLLPVDTYENEHSHGCDMMRYAVQINPVYQEVA